ncbi:unnamed protein product [Didymodactylos carnosus]|uniref:Uncharacterized protein n=1 Tax=Didymodactylos carnosus TaxID=1234261 RepID=A0A8S2E663_9BILA|nr:unnamed protein product [Didymodactylos carnosus]CAF3825037.1 unnamed protein product [Didymodactylos carnosus]
MDTDKLSSTDIQIKLKFQGFAKHNQGKPVPTGKPVIGILAGTGTNIILILMIFRSTETKPVQKETDQLCIIDETLCIKDELHKIRNALIKVNRTVHSIENQVISSIRTTSTFSSLIDYVIRHITDQNQMPRSVWSHRFAQKNNIAKEFLIEITSDMHDTMLLFYNTIEALITHGQSLTGIDGFQWIDPDSGPRRTFGEYLDKCFRDIHNDLRRDVICQIRNILSSYSTQWSSNNPNEKQIHFPQYQLSRASPSIQYRAKSVVLVRLLKETISKLERVIRSIENKFG